MTRVVNDVTLGEMIIIERQVCPPWPDKAAGNLEIWGEYSCCSSPLLRVGTKYEQLS